MIFCLRIQYVTVLILIGCCYNVQGVPPDYCLHPVNISDCGRAPTPVFYYYRPGSRCEIKMWMGCPTYNIFANEYECSMNCIYRAKSSDQDVVIPEFNKCNMPLDTHQCSNQTSLVYTHIGNGKCIEVQWRGCASHNIFHDYESCNILCNPLFNKILDETEIVKLEQMESLLDTIIDEIPEETTSASNNSTDESEETTSAPNDSSDKSEQMEGKRLPMEPEYEEYDVSEEGIRPVFVIGDDDLKNPTAILHMYNATLPRRFITKKRIKPKPEV